MHLNFGAILVAALSNFLVGGLWYSPAMFGKAWMRANGFQEKDIQRGSPAVIFGLAFVFCLIMAANLAAFLAGEGTTPAWGAGAGVLAGLGWVAMGCGVVALFERRPPAYMLIHAGYFTVSFALMGAILGAWR